MGHPEPSSHKRARRPRGGMRLIEVMVLIAGIALLFGMVTNMPTPREGTLRAVCTINLKQIGLALHNYQAVYGCFPPAYVADASGKPMHSWRVLILPYLEQQALYDRYRFDEPWDGPNNRKLLSEKVLAFTCPSHEKDAPATAYVAVLGPETAWPGGETVRVKDIKDGPSLTIHAAEVAAPLIHWMEPRDLHLDTVDLQINGKGGVVGPSSPHPGGANFLFADGSVQFLKNSTTPKSLRALWTIGGHEEVISESW